MKIIKRGKTGVNLRAMLDGGRRRREWLELPLLLAAGSISIDVELIFMSPDPGGQGTGGIAARAKGRAISLGREEIPFPLIRSAPGAKGTRSGGASRARFRERENRGSPWCGACLLHASGPVLVHGIRPILENIADDAPAVKRGGGGDRGTIEVNLPDAQLYEVRDGRAINDLGDAGPNDGALAHGARLGRGVEREIPPFDIGVQPRTLDDRRDFAVKDGIVALLVQSAADDPVVAAIDEGRRKRTVGLAGPVQDHGHVTLVPRPLAVIERGRGNKDGLVSVHWCAPHRRR